MAGLLTRGLGLGTPLVLHGLGVSSSASTTTPDLLTAIVAFLAAEPTVQAVLGVGYGQGGYGAGSYRQINVYCEEASADCYPPFLVAHSYHEVLPGETYEDQPVEVQIEIVTNGLDQARAIGKAVRNAIDNPNVNVNSIGRNPFEWIGGTETTCLRNNTRLERMRGIGRGGRYVYVEEIDYEFWVTPSQ